MLDALEYRAAPISVADVRDSVLSNIATTEHAFLTKGIISVSGYEIDANKTSLEWIRNIKSRVADTVSKSDSLRYILADNSVVDITYEVLDMFESSINQYLLEIHLGKQALRSLVEEATTIDELPNIVDEFSSLYADFVKLKN